MFRWKLTPQGLYALLGEEGGQGPEQVNKLLISERELECGRMDQTGEAERASGDEVLGGADLSRPPGKAGPGAEDEGGNDSGVLKH